MTCASRRVGVSVLAALVLVLATPVAAAPPAMPDAASGAGRAWMFSRLAEGNALLRRGRPRAAARVFREVFVQTEGTQWGTLAELGLAWSVASSGDVELGRALAADAHASRGASSPTTAVVLALLNARAGDYDTATTQLDAATRLTTDPTSANAIRLASAYVAFWAGDLERAAATFASVVAADPGGPLADDARYGAAWSRFRAGRRPLALDELAALVADAPAGHVFRSVPQRLVELDARAVLAASTRDRRREPAVAPEAQLAKMLDADGWSRARSALRLIARADRTAANGGTAAWDEALAPAGGAAASARMPMRSTAPDGSTAATGEPARAAPRGRWIVALAVLVGAAAFLATRRRPARVPGSAKRG